MRRVQRSELPQFSILLGALFLELVFAPLLMNVAGAVAVARVATALVLLAALGVSGLRRMGVVVFVLAMAGQSIEDRSAWTWAPLIAPALRLLFFGYVFARILSHVIRQEVVDLDTIAAAVCTYMLLGVIWGELYIITERLLPGSFSFPDSFEAQNLTNLRASLLYFSFTTLTTVGYGDIHPATPSLGGLAVSEAIAGQVYLAVLISRLVGMHLSSGVSPGGGTPGEQGPSSDGRRG
jgi:hypothetical protein